MRTALILSSLLLVAMTSHANETIGSVPWAEFRDIYRESIVREVTEQLKPEEQRQVYSLDEAQYTLHVDGNHVQGTVLVNGSILTGAAKPEPVLLFGKDMTITGVEQTAGGSMLLLPGQEGVFFLPDKGATEFQVVMSLSAGITEDAEARTVSLSIPKALRNTLRLSLPDQARLVGVPGILTADGRYHFSPRPCLTIRYMSKERLAAASLLEIESISRVAMQKGRIGITTYFAPVRPVEQTVEVHAPSGAQYIGTSLQMSWVTSLGENRYAVKLPLGYKAPFSVEFALAWDGASNDASFSLPYLENNTGQQGRFVVDEPDDGQVSVRTETAVPNIPVERLDAALQKSVSERATYWRTSVEESLTLHIERFQQAGTPTTVLDATYFFCSFEEGGNVLSVLNLTVPPDVGPRLKLSAVPNADIWSLTVNGIKREVYAGEDNSWIIPLDNNQPSEVALAFLRKGEKLGLHGRLDVLVPQTGLPCRDVRVGIAVPQRVDVLSIEGAVSPTSGDQWPLPREFVGKPHFFARSFYKGEGMNLAISYKEPVNH